MKRFEVGHNVWVRVTPDISIRGVIKNKATFATSIELPDARQRSNDEDVAELKIWNWNLGNELRHRISNAEI
jgi:hypothetical protein